MNSKTSLLILALAGIIVSCIPSLYPLYREKDLILDEKLLGRFGEPDEEEYYWEFKLLDTSIDRGMDDGWRQFKSGYTYRLTVMEEGISEEFAAHLLRLGEYLYLDFFPVNYTIVPAMLEISMAPSHIFARVEIEEENLILHFFDMDWLEDLIEKDRIKISHIYTNERIILTARTEELQKFILKFANDSTTFIEADTLPRWKSHSTEISTPAAEFPGLLMFSK